MKPSLVRPGSGPVTGLAMFVFVKALILYANEFIIDKKRDATYGLCRHNYWNSFLLVCKNSRFYNYRNVILAPQVDKNLAIP